jgi:hypothetical protein
MKNIQRILPVVAVLAALGGAIYHVRANAPQLPPAVEVSKAPPVTQSTAPVSDRYANNSAIGG